MLGIIGAMDEEVAEIKNQMTREFDSCIIKTVLAGRIKPVLFLSNFLH